MLDDFYTVKDGKKLKNGYTTGSCAAAASKAAAAMLLSRDPIHEVSLQTPAGVCLHLTPFDCLCTQQSCACSIVKDGGDDPDVTHGISIRATVSKIPAGIEIDGGEGVGRVTKPGLACVVGQAAINPVPRSMIEQALRQVSQQYGYTGGLRAVIAAVNGAEIAKQTFNPRLGIVGGISILGTSGIVEPMSEKALIQTIQLEMDSKLASGASTLLLCPGNYGRDFALEELGLDLETGVKCANYIGQALDYAVYRNVPKILLVGHAGKLSKIAGGIMNTHSRVADCRCEIFAAHAALAGASQEQIRRIMDAPTTDEIDGLLQDFGLAQQVWKTLLDKITFQINHRTQQKVRVEVLVFTNRNHTVKQTNGAAELIQELRATGGLY